jgi:hypothetical protein
VRWSRITGLAARAGEDSNERLLRLWASRRLSPRTALSAGVQHTRFDSHASGQVPYLATLVFVDMSHRF